MSADPFKITGNSAISFSGGRTSAYMLWRFIQANDGLPPECIVTFANTGKEDEATLRFVQRCSDEWDVPIVWLEWQWAEKTTDRFKVVDFETAARHGEPFEQLIISKKYLPNPVARICTANLKVRTIANYLLSIGHVETQAEGEDLSYIGIRADEQRRSRGMEMWRKPLLLDGITKHHVTEFWAQQPFDLELPNHNGVTPHGNCDLCYLKGAGLITSLILENPDRADWWARMETEVPATNQSGARWRNDRPTYGQMKILATDQGQLDLAGDETIPCYCGD